MFRPAAFIVALLLAPALASAQALDGHLKFFVPHRYRLTNSGIGSPSGRIGIGRPERSGTVTFLASIPRCR